MIVVQVRSIKPGAVCISAKQRPASDNAVYGRQQKMSAGRYRLRYVIEIVTRHASAYGLQVLFDQDPKTVGGSMPGDDFYYIP